MRKRTMAGAAVVAAGLLSLAGILSILIRAADVSLPSDVERRLRSAVDYEGPDKPDRIVRAAVEVGWAVGMDLPRLVKIARRVPEYYRADFYDGAAHGVPWPADHLPACYRAIDEAIPASYRRYLYHGPILRLARRHGGNPEAVLPRLADLPARARAHVPNGLRIGVLLACLPDWKGAVAAIAGYPLEYRATMFEELGWWMGEDLKADMRRVRGLLAQVPDAFRAEASQGYIRGLNLSDDRAAYESAIAQLDPECRPAAEAALDRKFAAWREDARHQADDRLRK